MNKLEVVQRHAARFVLSLYHNTSSVSRLIDQLRWPYLERRKKKQQKKQPHAPGDHLQNPSWTNPIRSKFVPPPLRQRRTHNQQFCLINTRTHDKVRLLPRTVRDWNHLPSETVEVATADAFVSRASAQ